MSQTLADAVLSWSDIIPGERHAVKILTVEDGDLTLTYNPKLAADLAKAQKAIDQRSGALAVSLAERGATPVALPGNRLTPETDPLVIVTPRVVGG